MNATGAIGGIIITAELITRQKLAEIDDEAFASPPPLAPSLNLVNDNVLSFTIFVL